LITYGSNPQADVRAENISFVEGIAHYDIVFRGRNEEESRIDNIQLPMPGIHNVLNSLPAAIVARRLGASDQSIRNGFQNFTGVKRRFTRAGSWNGVTIIDDYGHHPVEISAVLSAARHGTQNKVIAVIQPHRYTRLRDLFDDFAACNNDADIVLVTDVFAAGEAPIEGYGRDELVDAIISHGHREARALSSLEELPTVISEVAESGDYVVCLGAGDITMHANALASKLEALG